MAEVTAALVKQLRETTGAGMMDCKNALTETSGDIEAAIDVLKTKGLAKAAKKSSRVAAEGVVAVATSADGKTAAAIELNAETDFVARNEGFQSLARKIAQPALTVDGDVEALKNAPLDGDTVAAAVAKLVGTIGENLVLRRSARFSVDQGVVANYVHGAVAPDLGRIVVLVAVDGAGDAAALKDMGRKIGMHAAAMSPQALSIDEMDPAVVARERAIFVEQAIESGKPAAVAEKMTEGRIRKFYEEVVLLKQSFVMQPDQTVEQMVADVAKTVGSPVTVKSFMRLALGEGVEKAEGLDFAAEVASMTAKA